MGTSVAPVARRLLRSFGGLQRDAAGGVTLLAYHLVAGGTSSPVDLSRSTFERHLETLPELGRVVPLERALERLRSEREPSDEHWIVLTFDDAFRNFYDQAWPLLADRHLPATLYVPTGFLDGTSPSPLTGAEELPPATWAQLRELSRSGRLTLGSHSVSHPDLRSLDTSSRRAELEESRRQIEAETGQTADSFCYPRALWSAAVRADVAAIYASATIAGGRRNRPDRHDPHALFRLPLRRDMPGELFDVLKKPLWLEEWAASRLRGLRG